MRVIEGSARARERLFAGHVPGAGTLPDRLDRRAAGIPLGGDRAELAVGVDVRGAEDDDRCREDSRDDRPRPDMTDRPCRTAPPRRDLTARGREHALPKGGRRLAERHAFWEDADDLPERHRLAAARVAHGEMAGDTLRVGPGESTERVGLEVVEHVLGHRMCSSERRIFWRPMRMRPFTVPSGTPISSESSTWV